MAKELNKYVSEKVKLLKEFGIRVDYKKKMILRGLESEIAIDNMARSMIIYFLEHNAEQMI